VDFGDLTKVDHLVTALLLDEITRDQARAQLAQIVSTGHSTPRWAVTFAYGFVATGAAVMLGGDWRIVLIAFLAGMAVEWIQRVMARRRLPSFYQQVAGGLLATLVAVVAAATPIDIEPTLVVTAGIIMLLAGLGFIGAIQDALTGYYVTANARLLEVMLATAGIIVGVSGGLTVGTMLGVDVVLRPDFLAVPYPPLLAFGTALTAGAFAFAVYTPTRAVIPIALVATLGQAVVFAAASQGLGRAWSSAVAAVFIGAVSYALAGRVRVPSLVLVVCTIVPLLPGLSIYRGLSLISVGNETGVLAIANAAAIAISLSAGVILGEYFAQPLKREARRLERRLSGPRLVGPTRDRAVKRRRGARR
jgi:uncharacterized membrane protein YjjP (DUF1212 family)